MPDNRRIPFLLFGSMFLIINDLCILLIASEEKISFSILFKRQTGRKEQNVMKTAYFQIYETINNNYPEILLQTYNIHKHCFQVV